MRFEVKAEAKEEASERHKEMKSWSRLEEGVRGYEHTWTGGLDVNVSWVLSIIETPYYILMVME